MFQYLLKTLLVEASSPDVDPSIIASSDEDSSAVSSSSVTNENLNATQSLNWAGEWVGYIAFCMFSLVLVVPTLGIVGLMVWEYFSDEAERKAERKKEIDQAMEQHFGGGLLEKKKKKKKRLQKIQQESEQQNNSNMMTTENGSTVQFNDEVQIEDIKDGSGTGTGGFNNDESTCLLNDIDEYDDDSDDLDDTDSESLEDVDNVLKQADCLLHKRIRRRNNSTNDAANNFEEILT